MICWQIQTATRRLRTCLQQRSGSPACLISELRQPFGVQMADQTNAFVPRSRACSSYFRSILKSMSAHPKTTNRHCQVFQCCCAWQQEVTHLICPMQFIRFSLPSSNHVEVAQDVPLFLHIVQDQIRLELTFQGFPATRLDNKPVSFPQDF